MKIKNRFYLGAPSMFSKFEQDASNTGQTERPLQLALDGFVPGKSGRWTRPTLAAAVQHAENILNENTELESVVIVQAVRIVRRKRSPIVVEKVVG